MNLKPEELTLIGALAAALIVSVFSLLATLIIKRSEERKHFREMVITAAMQNWKTISETTAEKYVQSADVYILYMLKFCDMCLNERLNASTVTSKLAEVERFAEVIVEYKKKSLGSKRNP